MVNFLFLFLLQFRKKFVPTNFLKIYFSCQSLGGRGAGVGGGGACVCVCLRSFSFYFHRKGFSLLSKTINGMPEFGSVILCRGNSFVKSTFVAMSVIDYHTKDLQASTFAKECQLN